MQDKRRSPGSRWAAYRGDDLKKEYRMFGQHKPDTTRPTQGGVQHMFSFPNGYGASVVRNHYSYGGDRGLWELAVLDSEKRLTYETPVTSDVLGYLDAAAVGEALDRIAALPAVEAATR